MFLYGSIHQSVLRDVLGSSTDLGQVRIELSRSCLPLLIVSKVSPHDDIDLSYTLTVSNLAQKTFDSQTTIVLLIILHRQVQHSTSHPMMTRILQRPLAILVEFVVPLIIFYQLFFTKSGTDFSSAGSCVIRITELTGTLTNVINIALLLVLIKYC